MNPLRWTILLLACVSAAHAQVVQPSRVPNIGSSRVLTSVDITPSVNQATPRPAVLGIGGSVLQMTLTGSQLGPVTGVQVINAAGMAQPQIEAHINEAARASHTLQIQVVAKKNAQPGQYQFQLLLPADPRAVQDRPQNAPLGSNARTFPIPANIASLTVRKLEARIAEVAPTRPAHSTHMQPRMTVVDVPGSDIVSVTRFDRTAEGYCGYQPSPTTAYPLPGHRGDLLFSQWKAPGTLEVRMLIGQFEPASSCTLRLTMVTKNEFGEEFVSITPPITVPLAPPPPPARKPVTNTWALKDYLYLRQGFSKGICTGNSIGVQGAVPVGVVNVNGRLGFRARSGPIGTSCDWSVATNRLNPGWTLHMTFRIRRIGDQCDVGGTTEHGFDFSRHAHAMIRQDGEYSLAGNLSRDGNALKLIDLRCNATLSNDHEVLVEMVSATVSHSTPPENCDWRCAFQ